MPGFLITPMSLDITQSPGPASVVESDLDEKEQLCLSH